MLVLFLRARYPRRHWREDIVDIRRCCYMNFTTESWNHDQNQSWNTSNAIVYSLVKPGVAMNLGMVKLFDP